MMQRHSGLVTVSGESAVLRLGGQNEAHYYLENKFAHSKVLYWCHRFRLSYVQHKSVCIVLQSHKFEHTANFFTSASTLHTFVIMWLETWK